MVYHLIAFAAGFGLDLLLGDPLGGFHIVVWMGKLIAKLEKVLRRAFPASEKGELAGGAVLVCLVCLVSLLVSGGVLALAYRVHPILGVAADAFFCWQCLAARSLWESGMTVFRPLAAGDLASARAAVSMIVGRDTDSLDAPAVTRACVETIAENASDGVIAPMLYLIVGGAPLAVLYKAINTMDSMVGYKNDRYLYFGRAVAKTDDGANFIPSRIAGLLMVLAAFLCRLDGKNAWKVFRRDRLNHTSPNSAQTESACAGALRVRLGGPSRYFGKMVDKPAIGDDCRAIEPEDIPRAGRLMLASAGICFVLGLLIRGVMLVC